MNQLANLRWGLIAFLGVVALVRPLLSIAGAYDYLGGATGRVVVTILIAAVWIGAVVTLRVPRSLLTLAAAGTAYGLFTIFLQQVMWNLVLGEVPAEAPDSTPILVVSWVAILLTNTIYGAILGLVATGLGRLPAGSGSRSGIGA
jgi:membrane-anchored protein YejM (alkaline phosphatase superfamily)